MKRILLIFRRGKPSATQSLPIEKKRLFIDTFNEYVDRYLEENSLTAGTAKRYEVVRQHTDFFLAINGLRNLALEDIRARHAEDFRTHLKKELQTAHVRHISRCVEVWKRVTKYAQRQEYVINDPLSSVPAERDKRKKIITLSEQEVKKLMVYRFSSKTMRLVADLFIFQCFTGLSYSDIWTCSFETRNGRLWITGDRTKSTEEYLIPVFDEALEICQKYGGKLPQISNQKYNVWLKEVADIIGIKKKLTTHVGRKTHATLLAERGMGGKPISIILGNTEEETNSSYVNASPKIIINELQRLSIGDRLLA